MEENGSHLANRRWEECHWHSGAHPRTFPRFFLIFKGVPKSNSSNLPPLFPPQNPNKDQTPLFFSQGMAAETWSFGVRNFCKALHPLQSTHLSFSPRTFAVEQGQKSTQHCTCHTESDTPRGGEWRVQTAHDGLDESYGPKDLLLLKKPIQAMFHLLLPKVATQRKNEKWWGGGGVGPVLVFRSFARWCKWLEIFNAGSWGRYHVVVVSLGFGALCHLLPIISMKRSVFFSLSENQQVIGICRANPDSGRFFNQQDVTSSLEGFLSFKW